MAASAGTRDAGSSLPNNDGWLSWRRRPRRSLSAYVIELQGYVERNCPPIMRKELPSCVIPLIIVLGEGFTLHNPAHVRETRRLDRTFIAGLHTTPAVVGSRGDASCIQVNLTPLGARRLLRTEMADLANAVVGLDAFTAAAEADFSAQLTDTRDWGERFRRLEDYLERRLLTDEDDDPRVAVACRLLAGDAPPAGIGDLARHLNVSRKHLGTLFHRQVGCSPKVFMRIARFSRAIKALQGQTEVPFSGFADLAASCGYADQAHFSREFRAFAGESPRSLVARMRLDTDGIPA